MKNKQYICVAMRGRPIENPSCRIAGLPTMQRLEPNGGGRKYPYKRSKGQHDFRNYGG